MAKKPTTKKTSRKHAKRTTKKAAAEQARPTTKRKGILDIAAEMLARSKQPLGAKEIVEHALQQGLWSTSGKTPAATLYAAIIREIAAKGKDARFKKVDRGLFAATGVRS